MLSAVMALAITSLLSTLKATNAQDYVLACFFLISTTSFLKIRWFMGTGMQARRTTCQHTPVRQERIEGKGVGRAATPDRENPGRSPAQLLALIALQQKSDPCVL